MGKLILSLFDHSGQWSKPYRDAGYKVVQVDIKNGVDIMDWDYKQFSDVHGILAAPPCTDFALSGSRYFAQKDADGTTAKSIALVERTMDIVDHHKPKFWVAENPMSRIHKLCPRLGELKLRFNPYDYGDPYQKMTWLWGDFNIPVKTPVPNTQGLTIWKVGGKSDRTKEIRSVTPMGFANAFFKANP